MKTPDFAVSSQEAGFDKFLKVYNEYFKFDFFGNAKFYGAKNGENYQTGQAWITPITPSQAIALLTGKQLTEADLIVGNRFECIEKRHDSFSLFTRGCTHTCEINGTITDSMGREVRLDNEALNRHFKLLPTQESVKERNGDPSMYDMIQLVEQLESDKFHLQQQLNTLTSEIKRFQEKYDENGYDCSNEIKLLRIENHIDSTLSFYHKEVTDLQQQLKEAKELLEESFPIIQAAITLLRVAPNNNTLPEPPHDVIKLVKSINQFLTRNK